MNPQAVLPCVLLCVFVSSVCGDPNPQRRVVSSRFYGDGCLWSLYIFVLPLFSPPPDAHQAVNPDPHKPCCSYREWSYVPSAVCYTQYNPTLQHSVIHITYPVPFSLIGAAAASHDGDRSTQPPFFHRRARPRHPKQNPTKPTGPETKKTLYLSPKSLRTLFFSARVEVAGRGVVGEVEALHLRRRGLLGLQMRGRVRVRGLEGRVHLLHLRRVRNEHGRRRNGGGAAALRELLEVGCQEWNDVSRCECACVKGNGVEISCVL